ncbi:MAG: hypothetical protein U0Q08_04440 [Dermatophilaceae bacterium]
MTDLPGGPDRLAAAAARVYAVEPGEFLAVRSACVAEAKAAGDKEAAAAIGRLRKPSVAAWAINDAVRADEALVADLDDVGSRMRDAQSRLDVGLLAELRPARDALIEAFVSGATTSAQRVGRSLSAGVLDEVRATVVAALADTSASAAVSSGALTRSLSYSGFGEVDVADAVALTRTGRALSVVRGGAVTASVPDAATDDPTVADAGRDTAREDARAAARQALADADSAAAEADRALTAARSRVEDAEHLLEEARKRLRTRSSELATAESAAVTAAEARERAARDLADLAD